MTIKKQRDIVAVRKRLSKKIKDQEIEERIKKYKEELKKKNGS